MCNVSPRIQTVQKPFQEAKTPPPSHRNELEGVTEIYNKAQFDGVISPPLMSDKCKWDGWLAGASRRVLRVPLPEKFSATLSVNVIILDGIINMLSWQELEIFRL